VCSFGWNCSSVQNCTLDSHLHIPDVVLIQLIHCLVCSFGWNCSSVQNCTLDSHLHRVTYTRCRINTIGSLFSVQFWMELQFRPKLHTWQSPTQSDIYQISYKYNWFTIKFAVLDGTAVPSKIAHLTVTYTEWHISDVVLIQLIHCLVCSFGWNCSSVQNCTLDSHLHRVTYTRYRINTIDSPSSLQFWMELQFHPKLHTWQSPTQSDIYQMSY